MAGLETRRGEDPEAKLITRWRLEVLKRAGYERSVALPIAADAHIDLRLAIDLLGRGCSPSLVVRILQ